MTPVARRAWVTLALPVALVAVACNTTTQQDEIYPACNGLSPAGLASEASSKGQCPSTPVRLTGKSPPGTACGAATDCKPFCCPCSGGGGALVAQCENGNCLDGSDTCCLYAAQCAN